MYNKVSYDIKTDRFYLCPEQTDSMTPITLCYHIGYKCNLNCDYCLSQNVSSAPVLTDIREYIQYLDTWHPLRLVISGGEPLLYMDKLKPILKQLKDCNIVTFLSTNGILLRKEYPHLRGLVNWYDISLPAITETTYETVRGSDKFNEILAGIDLLIKNRERVRLTFTVNKQNINELLAFPEFALNLGVDNIRIGHTFSPLDGTLTTPLWTEAYTNILSKYKNKLEIYLPLSKSQLDLYNNGYIVLENDGSIYKSMVLQENYICHISEIAQFADVFSKIGELQLKLFAEGQNGGIAKSL